jgi:hypothetical protein
MKTWTDSMDIGQAASASGTDMHHGNGNVA